MRLKQSDEARLSRRVLWMTVIVPTVVALVHIVRHSVLPEVIPRWNATARQRTILYSADHVAIRQCGRELLSSVDPSDALAVDKRWGSAPDWNGAPDAVRALNPTRISLWGRDSLSIGCGPLEDDYGIVVFAADVQQSGTKQLVDGVWYFDSQNRIPPPGE
jgi:hypothetical protein